MAYAAAKPEPKADPQPKAKPDPKAKPNLGYSYHVSPVVAYHGAPVVSAYHAAYHHPVVTGYSAYHPYVYGHVRYF